MSAAAAYSSRVQELFAAPRRAGSLPDGPGEQRAGETAAVERGAWVRFEARVQGGLITAARFRAWGCPHVLAACELVAGTLEGQALADLGDMDARWLAEALEVPPEKLGRLLVIEDALRALAAAGGEAH